MSYISRIFLLVLGTIGVTVLGYYAYTIATQNLHIAFVGGEYQEGDTLRLFVKKPSFLSHSPKEDAVDRAAILGSILRDGRPYNPTVSAEGSIVVSGEYIEVALGSPLPGSTLRIDHDLYNQNKSTGFRLPRSIELRQSDIPKNLTIESIGLPRDATFSVEMYGYKGITPKDIRWYMHTDRDVPCSYETWDSQLYSRVASTEVQIKKTGTVYSAVYRLSYDTTLPYVCILGGVSGDISVVMDRYIAPFVATGSTIQVLSPEYDLQSELGFRFSSDLFRDTGSLYDDAYMDHRQLQKLEIIKRLDITPKVPITEENIVLSPNRLSVMATFQEGVEYTVRLRDVVDIHGRTTSSRLLFTPVSEPFLSIGLPGRRTMFRAGEDIEPKLYALKTPDDTYAIKLCRISLEGYARAERMIAEGSRENMESIYAMLDGGPETSNCTKKDISIEPGSTVSTWKIQDMYPDGVLAPGLYILAPREKDVALGFSRIVLPRVFSIVDTQITMKVDASGKMQILATDIQTLKPRTGSTVKLYKNILRTYTERWDADTREYIREYLPFANRTFSDAVVVGSTGPDGTLSLKKESIIEDEYSPPYGLMHEWSYGYEGQYQSFLATTEGGGHFGYVVSTWNDGISGWNFGLKDSDYSWETRGQYSAYIHTDRRLYSRSEKVYIHGIIRENTPILSLPRDQRFTVKVSNPLGIDVFVDTVSLNDFGSFSLELDLENTAPLGQYSIQVFPVGREYGAMEHGYTSFQVEVFRKPTFTADIKLRSPDITRDILLNLRKKPNTDTHNPWYKDVYQSTFHMDGIVRAQYYNGSQLRGVPFSYRVYRSPYYDASYWGDCFWGCFWQPAPEFYTEGQGRIDNDGMGVFRVGVDFSSFYEDYQYIVEVTITDPTTGETVVTPATLLARIPGEYKGFDPYNKILFSPQKRILDPGEVLSGVFSMTHGQWDHTTSPMYQYELIHRAYVRRTVDDLRMREISMIDSRDTVVQSGPITATGVSLSTVGLTPGEYIIRTSPYTAPSEKPPETSISETIVYISGDFVDRSASLRVIPEKTIYQLGETAKVLFTTPFTGGYIYITRERGGVIDHEYVAFSGSSITREYRIDESFYPNVYLSAIAFPPSYHHGGRNYAVGYSELIMDLSDRVADLSITPDKSLYKNRETVTLDILLRDKNSKPLEGEVTLMVVDESLIRLLGNIDLDIVPKFFRKHPFTMKTAMTFIGMERNRFVSRRGANGGSGAKGGLGSDISSRTLFQNTAYYNPSVRTDKNGKAKVQFTLPDNITDYRIISIAHTRDSLFAVDETPIQVRRDYTIEAFFPYIVYHGDTFGARIALFNATRKITPVEIDIIIGTGTGAYRYTTGAIIQAMSSVTVPVDIRALSSWDTEIPYTVTLRDGKNILDSITKKLNIQPIPHIADIHRVAGFFSGSTITVPMRATDANTDIDNSYITLNISRTPLRNPQKVIESMVSYPYGCVEQTLSTTFANVVARSYMDKLSLSGDADMISKNIKEGIAKVLSMQYFGGWKYWESDYDAHIHVTPYVLRSLGTLRDMGISIPQSHIDMGLSYLIEVLEYRMDQIQRDPNLYAEIFATLAQYNHPRAESMIGQLEVYRTNPGSLQLDRHGFLMYMIGRQSLGRLTESDLSDLDTEMHPEISDGYWYWDMYADRALYAQLLIQKGDRSKALDILDGITREVDMSSYYVSTQAKSQILLAIIRLTDTMRSDRTIALSLESLGMRAGLDMAGGVHSNSLRIPRGLVSESIVIKRTDSGAPLFYEVIDSLLPLDVSTMSPRSSSTMSVNRVFELVDESRGMDTSGQWIATKMVDDGIFSLGKLYRVTLTVTPPKHKIHSYYLTLEDFVPGAWRPIRGVFRTEMQYLPGSQSTSPYMSWTQVEALPDRILATNEQVYNPGSHTYAYYIRPEYTGTYLLPPVTAYYMYEPEVHAIGRYQNIRVE